MRSWTRDSERRRSSLTMALLKVEDLSIEYRTREGSSEAVEGVSFAVEEGQSLGFVGESGCGKTTIGMAIMRLLPPNASVSAGRILFEGEDLFGQTDEEMRKIRWNKIAMIFQAAMNALNPVQRVEDQIAEAILTHEPGLEESEAQKRVEDLYDLVGIPKDPHEGLSPPV